LASNVYECLFILDSNRYARDPNTVAATIPVMVQDLGGEVLANRLWTEQRLAYPIKGNRKGTYWLTYFRLDAEKVSQFNRACQLNDYILRNLVVQVDPRLVDVLVSHALGKSGAPKDEGVKPSAEKTTTKERPESAGATEKKEATDGAPADAPPVEPATVEGGETKP